MLLLALACGTSGGRIEALPQQRVDAGPVALWTQRGARVRIESGAVAVDAPEGRRWFDLAWVEGEPEVQAEVWAAAACQPIVWDAPVVGATWWARGGMCTVSERRHWALVLFRPVTGGQGWVRTTYLADHAFVPYEDAWVDYAATALSVGVGAPAQAATPVQVREAVRAGAANNPGTAPILGGGLLSTRVHRELGPRYDALVPLPAVGPRADQR